MTPFERFFAEDWHKMMEAVTEEVRPHLSAAKSGYVSWDRKAAFLVWDRIGRPGAAPQSAPATPATPAVDDLFA